MNDVIASIAAEAAVDGCMLDGLAPTEVADTILEFLQPLGGCASVLEMLHSDIASIVMGSAIEVQYTLSGVAVAVEIDNTDDLVVTLDGDEAIRLDITYVETSLRLAA